VKAINCNIRNQYYQIINKSLKKDKTLAKWQKMVPRGEDLTIS